MSRSGGQSEARPPVFKCPNKFGTHLSTHCRHYVIVTSCALGLDCSRDSILQNVETVTQCTTGGAPRDLDPPEIRITQECGCVGFNGPDGRQGCVLTRTVESNQGGRFDSNESVADSFPSGAVGFKSWSARILGAFSLLRLPEKTSSREVNSLPEVTLRRSYPLR
ncbi:hypothetical protein TNCV_4431721 [Trichonephila clavipes]|nr:hypothetical protein TNCV_4431721 [Trichonephila clavipes]